MKYLVMVVVAISLFSFVGINKGFIIEGSLSGYEDGTVVYLRNLNYGILDSDPSKDYGYTDSAILKNESFCFKGKLKYPQSFAIQTQKEIEDKFAGYKTFWVYENMISYKASKVNTENAEIKGSGVQKQANEFAMIIKSENEIIKSYISYANEGNISKLKEYKLKKDEAAKAIKKKEIEFIQENPDYLYSAILLSNHMYEISDEEIIELFSALSKKNKNSHIGKEIGNYMNK